MNISRRKFLHYAASSGVSMALASCAPRSMGNMNRMMESSPTTVVEAASTPSIDANITPDVVIQLSATMREQQLLSGAKTQMAQYVGTLVQGTSDNLQSFNDSYIGPTIRVQRGQTIRIEFKNLLNQPSTIHWHGQHLPTEMDGHPLHAVAPEQTFIYQFKVQNRAGTYWYHPHPHKAAGAQLYVGLIGLFIVEEPTELTYGLPNGAYDLPLIIQDRTFDSNNQLTYVNNMHQIMTGYFGRKILVNGAIRQTKFVEARAYRLRLVNGSNARTYKLAWQDGTPLTVIASDGGLLAAPIQRDFVLLGAAERIEIWVDFSEFSGAMQDLVALPFTGGNTETVAIQTFEIGKSHSRSLDLPVEFSPLGFDPLPTNLKPDRSFDFYVNHMTPTIDGLDFELNSVRAKETVKLGTTEIWEFTNHINGARGFPHPVHVHGLQFQVLERTGTSPEFAAGYVDDGWKDTVLLMPNERVKVRLKFEDYTGLFLYHCHNMEHEDGGMMRNYKVVA